VSPWFRHTARDVTAMMSTVHFLRNEFIPTATPAMQRRARVLCAWLLLAMCGRKKPSEVDFGRRKLRDDARANLSRAAGLAVYEKAERRGLVDDYALWMLAHARATRFPIVPSTWTLVDSEPIASRPGMTRLTYETQEGSAR
jgi:hypothetical protein